MNENERMTRHLATRVWHFLQQHNLTPDNDEEPSFFACPLSDRALFVFNPASNRNLDKLLANKTTDRLSRNLGGRRVQSVGQSGIYLQIAYKPAKHYLLNPQELDLSKQPTPLSLPIGVTKRGPLWLPLPDVDSALIAGARQMGKTSLLHAWIQALQAGKRTEMLLWDGKDGVEFARYENEMTHHNVDIDAGLQRLADTMRTRQDQYKSAGARSYRDYAEIVSEPTIHHVIVVDEATDLPDHAMEALQYLIRVGGACAIHPVLGTQHPQASAISRLISANLKTRIALPVPTATESVAILGHGGAEKLKKTPGRLLVEWRGRAIESQSFLVSPPRKAPTIHTHLSDAEYRVALSAIQDHAGWFRIIALRETTDESRDWINTLAKKWEALGYLTEVLRNDRGYNTGRRVTPALRKIVDDMSGESGSSA